MNMSPRLLNRALTGALVGLMLCAAPGFAQRPAHRNTQAAHLPKKPQGRSSLRLQDRGVRFAQNRYILFLRDEPVAAHFAARDQLETTAAISYRRQIESRQQSVIQDLSSRKILVAGSASMVMNAIFVVATPDRLAELRSVPGVIGVMPERLIQPDLNKATALANAPAAWAQLPGGQVNAGAGIKIGILDSGIDQTNPAFNDSGFTAPSGFPKCNTPPAGTGTPSDCGLYTNNKVIVARSYVSMIAAGTGTSPAANSSPDDYSARDRVGHGSAVAAVAAAVQVPASSTGSPVAFSGMAPKAFLGSYKIYGSGLVGYGPPESVLIKALDDAVSDGMNVVNFSSGSPAVAGAKDDTQCGNASGVWCDPLAHAFEVAAENGTVITTSVGNNGGDPYGDLYYNTIASPATAPSVIAVGATINSHVFNPTVSVNGSGAPSNLQGITANLTDASFTYNFLGTPFVGAASGVLVDAATLGDAQACSTLAGTVAGYPNLGPLADKWALIQRSPTTGAGCSFDVKAQNAAAAGAIGIVFYMADNTTLAQPTGICYANSNNACDFYGPAVIVSQSDGQNLQTYIKGHPGTTVTINTAGAEAALSSAAAVNTLASYSSEGPAIDGSIKPDIVATGGFDGYQSAYPSATNGMLLVGQSYDPNGLLYTSNGFAAANGTSFAAPLVAGAAALVLQAHPTWTAAKVKSALVNYAAQTVTQDINTNTVDVQEIGAGLLDANGAVTATVTAAPPTLSFGYLATGSLPKSIAVTLTNNGSASVTLAAKVVPGPNTTTAATVTTTQSSLTIAGGATATLNVSLGGTLPSGGEYSGAVTLTSTSPAITLRLPYMFLVGDGTSPAVNPLYDMGDWQNFGSTVAFGAVSQDIGPLPVQVIDQWGVPVPGQTVTYTVTPSGSLTLKSATGTPGGAGFALPFQPAACSVASSTSTLTCPTNNYGIAWVEMFAGPTAVGSSNPAGVDACFPSPCTPSTAQIDIPGAVSITAVPSLTKVYENNAGGSTLAPGSYVQLSGSNLADPNYLLNSTTGDKVDTAYTNGRLPLTMDYVTVSFDAAATGSLPAISVPGYVEYVSTGVVNVFVPWELENYPSAQVKMTYANSVPTFSNVLTATLANYTPTFFMYYPGSGSALIADAVDPNCPAPYIIGAACPAKAGDLVEFYANGLGPTNNQPASGNPASSDPNNLAKTSALPVVMIGGQQAQVQFSGLAPGFVGLYQVNAYIPSGLSSGNQPITIAIGGQTSPASITSGGTTYQVMLPIK